MSCDEASEGERSLTNRSERQFSKDIDKLFDRLATLIATTSRLETSLGDVKTDLNTTSTRLENSLDGVKTDLNATTSRLETQI